MKHTARFKMWPSALVAFSIILSIVVTPADAFFRNLCHGQIGLGRVDPIVSPGKASAHVHNIQGAANFGFDSSAEDLMASDCTSCAIREDKSSYWSPQLYFQHVNGTFEIVPTEGGLTAYYFTERPLNPGPPNGGGDTIHAFPKGFRMVTGNNFKRTNIGAIPDKPMSLWNDADLTQEALMEKSLGFQCMHYYNGVPNEATIETHYLRNKTFLDSTCHEGVRAEIQFPSCWNGKDLDSVDHKSHVLYPPELRDGPCPVGFTTRVPTILFETIYQTNLFKGIDGQFVFANGDPTGYGYHADFLAAWDDGILDQVINNSVCTFVGSNGEATACPVFKNLKSPDHPDTMRCKMETPDSLKAEAVNMVPALPGNVAVHGGPEPAPMPGMSSVAAPFVTPTTVSSASLASPTSTTVSYANTTSAAPPPATTPAPTTSPAHTNQIITKTSVTIIGGTVYHWVILEEVVTTTVIAESPTTTKAKRHGHGHRHHGRR